MASFNPKDLLPKSASTTATKRSGVGSTKMQDNISEDWTKFGKRQILSIGNNKKRHNQQHDDIEEDDNIDIGNDSSSDEEEGRTSAVREKKKRKVVAKVSSTHQIDVATITTTDGIQGVDSTVDIISTTNTKKKKKKKGKKERAKDNKDTSTEQQSLNENTTDAQQSIAKEVAASEDAVDATKDDSITNTNDKSNTTTTNTKRKRKKVRSRQKNIRKDNREVKPSHLIVGNEDYKGRPMTKETCEKLGIQSKSEGKKKRKDNVDAMFDSGEWVGSEDKTDITTNDDETAKHTTGEEDIKQPKEDVGDTLTRIGDCIVGNSSNIDNDDTIDDVGENLLNEDSKKKKGKKHKKRKFKNLVVG